MNEGKWHMDMPADLLAQLSVTGNQEVIAAMDGCGVPKAQHAHLGSAPRLEETLNDNGMMCTFDSMVLTTCSVSSRHSEKRERLEWMKAQQALVKQKLQKVPQPSPVDLEALVAADVTPQSCAAALRSPPPQNDTVKAQQIEIDPSWPSDAVGARKALMNTEWLGDVLGADTRLLDELLVSFVQPTTPKRMGSLHTVSRVFVCFMHTGNGAMDSEGNGCV